MNKPITMETIEYATAEDLLNDAINVGRIQNTIGDEWAYWLDKYGDWQTALWKASLFYLEVFLESIKCLKTVVSTMTLSWMGQRWQGLFLTLCQSWF